MIGLFASGPTNFLVAQNGTVWRDKGLKFESILKLKVSEQLDYLFVCGATTFLVAKKWTKN